MKKIYLFILCLGIISCSAEDAYSTTVQTEGAAQASAEVTFDAWKTFGGLTGEFYVDYLPESLREEPATTCIRLSAVKYEKVGLAAMGRGAPPSGHT